jgi:hypothetical protein
MNFKLYTALSFPIQDISYPFVQCTHNVSILAVSRHLHYQVDCQDHCACIEEGLFYLKMAPKTR